jgi:RNA polymerase sigma factor (sigma-70 family)
MVALREQTLRSALDRLPETEQNVVRLRYGINGDQSTSARDVGRRLGISRREVEEMEERALARLAGERELQALDEAA